eukprot:scaffold5444_cov181-Ochromonas_danica.AAC.11
MANDDDVEAKIQAVYAEVEKKTREAEMLSAYLQEQQQLAHLTEEKEEEDLKRQGIIVGQHIPSLPSRLHLDPQQLSEFENFSSTVLVAKDLMIQNRTNFLRRTGNLPISDLAETRKEASLKYVSEMTEEVPHYLLQTRSADIRKERNTVRFEETIQAVATATAMTRSKRLANSKTAAAAETKSERVLPISAKERLEHEKVLQSINHKLQYLRNPRNDPAAVSKMLVKPKAYFVNKQKEEEASLASQHDAASLKKKYAKHTLVQDNPLFVCEPSSVFFIDYEIGQKYNRTLIFRNTSAVTRSVQVVPPKSSLFTLSAIKYPTNSVGGMVAPGMSVSTVLTFIPKELGDFEDFVKVLSESGSSEVRIVAQREPPQLSIPPIVGLPDCLVGDAQRSSLTCVNNGGRGKFVLYAEGVDKERMDQSNVSLRIPPFTLYPTSFTLDKGESIDLVIEFVPLTMGLLQRRFSVFCDNGQEREFTIQARSKQLQVTMAEINHVLFDFHDNRTIHDMVFQGISIGSDSNQQLVVINDTGLAVEYEWVWMNSSIPDDSLSKEGQKVIRSRQSEERPITGSGDDGSPDHGAMMHSLKQSLDMTKEDGNFGHSDSENRVVEGSLEIYPARGVIAGEGAAEFQVLYAPQALEKISLQAVLMIKSIPQAALPSPKQTAYLTNLAEQGHGQHVRLLSWLEDLASMGTVTEYEKPNGSPSTQLPLLQLSTIVHMVQGQVMGAEETLDAKEWQEEIRSFHKLVHLLLKHTYDSRVNNGLSDDDSTLNEEGSVIHEKDSMIDLYDWDGDSGTKPEQLYPYSIPTNLFASEEEEEDEEEEAEGEREAVEQQDHSSNLSDYNEAERSMLVTIWVDIQNAVKIFGTAIATLLNDKVMHEAVEYLKDCALNHLACFKLDVLAESVKPRVTVSPPCLEYLQPISIGKECQAEILLENHSNAPVQLKIMKNDFIAKRLFSTYSDEIAEDNLPNSFMDTLEIIKSFFTINCDFDNVLIMPKSTEKLSFSVVSTNTGRFAVTLPLRSERGIVDVESIQVFLNITGPKLKFLSAEIDLGLLGVGQEQVCPLSFVNEGDVPVMFIMKPQLYIETTIPKKGGASSNQKDAVTVITSRPNTNRDPGSARSTMSRQSMRSDDFSVADSAATSTDFKIEMKNAVVTIEPSSGVVQPGTSFTVNICGKAGKLPQRIRGMLESRLFDEVGQLEIHRQYLNLRGEVQQPKVMLYPMQHNLGQVYVGRPVKFQLTLENVCNLPTKFKFLRPGGQSSLFHFTVNPTKGSLEAKEKLLIEGVFTALTPGAIDDVISCKMFGITLPLGFALKAFAKGIQLDFVNLADGDPLPPPLADPEAVQFPGGGKAPEAGPVHPIFLGDQVPLYERRSGRFVIRNLSAIPAAFEIRPRKFVVVEVKGRKKTVLLEAPSSSTSLASSVALRKDAILAPHEEGTNKFQSMAGKKYIGAIVDRRDDKVFLKSGLGAAYAFSTALGVIPPWGVQEVFVHAYNDIPGCYDDDIEVSLHENEIVRKFLIPVKLSVVGCPVVIEKSTVGMTTMGDKGPQELRGKQLLQLGQGYEHGPPLVREFFVRNHGSKSAQVKWMIRGLASKMNGPVKVGIVLDPVTCRAKCQIRYWEDLAKESPFVVQPASYEVPPYGKALFRVTLARSSPAVLERAQLTAIITVPDNMNQDDASLMEKETGSDSASLAGSVHSVGSASVVPRSRSMSSVGLKKHNFSLQMIVEGSFIHPQLAIEKRIFSISQSQMEVSEQEALALKAKATLLFSSDGKLSQPCKKLLTLANPLDISAVFTVSTEGSVAIKDLQDSSSVKEEGSHGSHTSKITIDHKNVPVTSSTQSSHGRSLHLGPQV